MHWCLGMYGSASTWTYYVVQKLAAVLIPERPVVTRYVESNADLDANAGTIIVKTHAAPAYAELAPQATVIIITIRDPRDAIASLVAHNKAPFDLALDLTEAAATMCGNFSIDPRALLFRFEDRFYDRPETIEKLAATFGRPLRDEDRDRIFAETRREAIEQFIAGLETLPSTTTKFMQETGEFDTQDLATGWHKHHAGRRGQIGRWEQELSEAQIGAIEARLRWWMNHFGYRPHTRAASPYSLKVGQYRIDI